MLGRAIIGEGTCIMLAGSHSMRRAYACACCRPVQCPPGASVHPRRGTRHTARPWRHVRARGTEPLAWLGVAVNARELARRHATDKRGARPFRPVPGGGPRRESASAFQPGKAAAPVGGPTPPRGQSGIDLQGITVCFRPLNFFPPPLSIFPSGNNRFLLFPLGGPSPTRLLLQ